MIGSCVPGRRKRAFFEMVDGLELDEASAVSVLNLIC